jgi:hypothetical protein
MSVSPKSRDASGRDNEASLEELTLRTVRLRGNLQFVFLSLPVQYSCSNSGSCRSLSRSEGARKSPVGLGISANHAEGFPRRRRSAVVTVGMPRRANRIQRGVGGLRLFLSPGGGFLATGDGPTRYLRGRAGGEGYVGRYRQPQTRRPLCHQHRRRRRRGPTTTTCALCTSSSILAPFVLAMPNGIASAAFGAMAQPIVLTPAMATAAPGRISVSIVRRLIAMCLLPCSRIFLRTAEDAKKVSGSLLRLTPGLSRRFVTIGSNH